MLRITCMALALGGCSSQADTCDLQIAGDIELICTDLRATVDTGSAMHVMAPIPCDGSGSGTMAIGGDVQWSGTFTFDHCTKTVRYNSEVLTLTGTVHVTGDSLNDGYSVMTDDMLAIRADVAACAVPVDETCAPSSWGPDDSFQFTPDHNTGTLCGRHFP